MDDLEMTKLCAEAMGWRGDGFIAEYRGGPLVLRVIPDEAKGYAIPYDPLTDDAQAMALVKQLGLDIEYLGNTGYSKDTGNMWDVTAIAHDARSSDLNRAIVECVAKMQSNAAKSGQGLKT